MPSNRQILEQRQQLRQWISPQQKLLGHLIEMNSAEIEEEVRRVTEENPAIELSEKSNDSSADLARDEEGNVITETAEDMQNADYRSEDDIPFYRTSINNHSRDDETYEPVVVAENSIIDYLSEQVLERNLSQKEQLIAQYIIGNISDTGYLQRSVESMTYDFIDHTGFDVTEEEIEKVLKTVQELDPPGVGASDLRECLLLQLKRKGSSENARLAYTVIDRHFEAFTRKHYDKIASALGISTDKLKDVLKVIRSLNPKPGNAITGVSDDSHSQQITPDFSVESDGEELTLSLNNGLPELQISESYDSIYQQYCQKKPTSAKERSVANDIRDKYLNAQTFIVTLSRRQETLFNTMKAIMRRQKDFFLTGDPSELKPMVLREVAQDLNCDISLISRATRNKYVSTEWGVFPLTYFFTKGIQHDSGEDVSVMEILSALKSIVSDEDKSNPYSDEKLCEMLKERGYSIARRTIAKYREKLSIPVARLRKEI